MANEFKVKNGLIVIGDLSTSGTITINGALAATQSWVTSQAYLTSASLSGYATQSYVTSAIAALVDSAPAALDTLNELAAALGDDANFATTITTSIGNKVSKSGDTMTGDLTLNYGYPRINFYDSNHDSDYSLINNDGGFSLYDITNNVHRWWVTSGGNVGIGTTSPIYKLHVAGSTYVNGGTLFLDSGEYLRWGNSNQGIVGVNDSHVAIVSGGSTRQTIYADGRTYFPGLDLSISNVNSTHGTGNYFRGDGSHFVLGTSGTLYLNYGGSTTNITGTTYINGNLVWHAGNDGTGSTLDADLLDGFHASQSGGGSVVLTTASNGYLYVNNWIHPANGTGLFYDSGPHFYESGGQMYSSHTLRVNANILITDGADNNRFQKGSNWLNLRDPWDNVHLRNSISGYGIYTDATIHYWRPHDGSNNYMTLSSTGLGIGTSSPSAKLHVNGTFISNAFWTNSSSIAFWGAHDTAYGGLTWDTGQATVYATSGNKLYLASNGSSPDVTIATNGDVGIGTTSPGQKLSVAGNIETTSGTGVKIGFNVADSFTAYGNSVAHYGISYNYSSSPIALSGYFGVGVFTNGVERIRVENAGNVGIGITSPTALLHVANSGRMLGVLRIQGTNRTSFYDNTFAVNNDGGGADGFIYGSNVGGSFPFDGYGEVIIQANPRTGYSNGISLVTGTTSPTIKLRVTETGNVGIGTSSPGDYKLYVNGGQFGTLLRGGDLGTGSDVVRMIKADNSIAMLVRGDGKVGIGTLSPSEEFHVVGRGIFDGGSGNSSTDAVLYVTKSTNDDWGLYVNNAGLDYGMYTRVSPSASYAFAIHNGTTWTTRIAGNGVIYLNEKDTINPTDSWLRLNNSGSFTSGVYTPGILRNDGAFNNYGGIYGYDTIRGRKSQIDNLYTSAALWTESYDNTTTGVAFHISGVVGKFLEMRTNGILYWDNASVITTANVGSQSVASATTSTSTYRGIIEDTRAAERTPSDYDDYRVSWEFTNQITGLSGWKSVMTMQGWHNGYAAWQLIGGSDTSINENWYLRSGNVTTWSAVRRIWHDGDFTSTNVSNWNTAYGWGNHASAGYATTSYVTTQINNLIAGAPGALDTLDELAAALGDDSNFATTVTNSIATKATYNSTRFTGDLNTLGVSTNTSGIYTIGAGYTNGPGSTALYGTLYTFWNSDISVQIWPTYNGDFYWRKSIGASFSGSTWRTIWDTSHFSNGDISNWNTAYGWGNHASAGYAAASSLANYLPLAGGTMTGDITLKYDTSNNGGYNGLTFAPGSDDYIIKASSAYGVFGRQSFGWHVNSSSAFGVYSSGWVKLFGVEGGTGNTQVFGNLTVNGVITESSSLKLKENVETSEGNLEKVVNLRPVTYNKIGSQTTELGLIAEEVAEVYPEFVQYDENGDPIGVHYSRLTAALIGAVKQLTKRIETLENNG